VIVLADALDHLVRGIVDSPDDVTVKERSHRRGITLRVRVNPADMGRVIGKATSWTRPNADHVGARRADR
jgi:predicted RNA-binding protein YlqC (UPF0109 family)